MGLLLIGLGVLYFESKESLTMRIAGEDPQEPSIAQIGGDEFREFRGDWIIGKPAMLWLSLWSGLHTIIYLVWLWKPSNTRYIYLNWEGSYALVTLSGQERGALAEEPTNPEFVSPVDLHECGSATTERRAAIGRDSSTRSANPHRKNPLTMDRSGAKPQGEQRSSRRLGERIRFDSVFISFSFADLAFAQRLHSDLRDHGVRCWFSPDDIKGGEKIHEQVDRAIRSHNRLLLVLSKDSMASSWVQTEIANARRMETDEGRQVLFPIRLVDFASIRDWTLFDAEAGVDSASVIREYFIPDFSDWENTRSYRRAFKRLLNDLKTA